MDLGLKGKRAVVVAGTSGLGLAIAQELAAEGASVAICGRDEAKLKLAEQHLEEQTGRVPFVMRCDVAQPDSLAAYIEASAVTLGGIDILVANAGGPPPGDFETLDEANWAAAFQLTLMSVVRAVRYSLPHLHASKGGSILALASSSVKAPIPRLLLSNVFRPAVAALCKSLAEELAPDQIRVNVLAPGRIETARTAELDKAQARRSGRDVDQVRADSEARIPLGRYGRPDEFAKVAAFMVSDSASYVTGSTILVDGGLVKTL